MGCSHVRDIKMRYNVSWSGLLGTVLGILVIVGSFLPWVSNRIDGTSISGIEIFSDYGAFTDFSIYGLIVLVFGTAILLLSLLRFIRRKDDYLWIIVVVAGLLIIIMSFFVSNDLVSEMNSILPQSTELGYGLFTVMIPGAGMIVAGVLELTGFLDKKKMV